MNRSEVAKVLAQLIPQRPGVLIGTLTLILDISRRRVFQLQSTKVLPGGQGGLYDLLDCCHRYLNHLRALAVGQGSATIEKLKAENISLKNEKIRLENLVRKGELIARSEILGEFSRRISFVKAGLQQFSRTLPGELIGKSSADMQVIIAKRVRQLLLHYAGKSKTLNFRS